MGFLIYKQKGSFFFLGEQGLRRRNRVTTLRSIPPESFKMGDGVLQTVFDTVGSSALFHVQDLHRGE